MQSWLDIAGEQLIVLFFLATGISNLTKSRIADHIYRMRAFGVSHPAAAFWLGIALQFAGCALIELNWHPAIGGERGGASLPGDAPALDDRMPVGEPHEALDVLVDHQNRLPGLAQAAEAFPDFLAHEWRQALGRLVEY